MKTSIVIPSYNRYDLLHQLLYDLYTHCRDDIDEVLVVDNGSDDNFRDGLDGFWFKQQLLPIKVLTLKENIGFLKAANAGMAKASGDILILISNDVRVLDNLPKLVKNKIIIFDNILIGNRLITFDSGWNTFDGKTFSYLEGWLLACTKKCWEWLGGFDERFAPNDYEDIDLSTTANSLGIKVVSLNNDRVWHLGAQTIKYSPEREAITKRNRELFRQKWMK